MTLRGLQRAAGFQMLVKLARASRHHGLPSSELVSTAKDKKEAPAGIQPGPPKACC
jgi:hypothetical protein